MYRLKSFLAREKRQGMQKSPQTNKGYLISLKFFFRRRFLRDNKILVFKNKGFFCLFLKICIDFSWK
ncbi:MAG: hypothetical protein EBS28_00255 [Chlamydiae bacterium]|nr:hypothetical protein [Chlamydiota bacterium]